MKNKIKNEEEILQEKIKKWYYEITYVSNNKTYIENLIINNN